MGRRKRTRNQGGPALTVPDALVEALEGLYGRLDAPRRVDAVRRLNAGLTGTRAAAGADYLRDRELRAAYATYYLCANVAKPWPLLDRLALPERLRALELGGGPGTGVASLGLWARARGVEVELVATDRLEANVQAAAKLARALDLEVETRAADLGAPLGPQVRGPFDLVLLMNVVNELPTAWDARLSQELRALLGDAGTLLVVEPAAREPSRRALAFRDALVAGGWSARLPCPHSAACPALAIEGEWCHGAWRFERPAFMRAIDVAVGLRREALKATYFALTPAPVAPRGVTVVSDRFDEKGRSRLVACTSTGLETLELQRRDRSPANADFLKATRHDRLLVEGTSPAGEARRVDADGRVERLSSDTVPAR